MARDLMLELAEHLEGIAATIRRHCEPTSRPAVDLTVGVFPAKDAVYYARQIHPMLGSHQEMIIQKLADAFPDGLSVSQINPSVSSQPNSYTTLDKLIELGLVRQHDGRPKRYFLSDTFGHEDL